jgi:hypothetical protein
MLGNSTGDKLNKMYSQTGKENLKDQDHDAQPAIYLYTEEEYLAMKKSKEDAERTAEHLTHENKELVLEIASLKLQLRVEKDENIIYLEDLAAKKGNYFIFCFKICLARYFIFHFSCPFIQS